jgi:hypothetical protein
VGGEQTARVSVSDGDRIAGLLGHAHELVRDENYEGARELYQMAAAMEPGRFELEGYVDLVRSRLVKNYREKIGDGRRVPRLLVPAGAIPRFNLPAEAGFVLSLVDGRICFDELVSVSGLAPFEALRTLAGLVEARIVGVPA